MSHKEHKDRKEYNGLALFPSITAIMLAVGCLTHWVKNLMVIVKSILPDFLRIFVDFVPFVAKIFGGMYFNSRI